MRLGKAIILVLGLTVSSLVANTSGNIDKREYVCMMQDMILAKPGIPIEHNGKRYYGCCEMCKEKIAREPEKYTTAVDPVSKKKVDKATAFIYAYKGDAYYFGSKENRAEFGKNPHKYLEKYLRP